jgi:hypothetical protein
METECVYCAVRADSLSIIQFECNLQIGRVVEVSVSHWPGFDFRQVYEVLWWTFRQQSSFLVGVFRAALAFMPRLVKFDQLI